MPLFGFGKKKKDVDSEKKSQEVERNLQDGADANIKSIKLLLLGAGESGKSTLFKQATKLYGKGFDKEALKGYARGIVENVLNGMRILCKQSAQKGGDYAVGEEAASSAQYFLDMRQKDMVYLHISDEAAEHVKILWADNGIQHTWANRADLSGIAESVSFFFEEVDRIKVEDFSPSHTDVIKCRARTTGIVETHFVMNNSHFRIMDVGGQRSERKKWIHCFEDVMAILFVTAISEYDLTCFEDGKTNRVTESLSLFDDVCNQGWFANASVILFLNKRDLFADKIKKVPLNNLFPEYEGGNDYDAGVDFLKAKFLAQNRTEHVRVFTHVTCATDEENVQFTFDAVKSIVLENSLSDSGLN
jgi:GTPase SAR1 family protein